jgi:uncharacterized protein (DUF58 family)
VDQTATLTPERLLRRLEWRIVRRLDGRLQGDYRTFFRGTGVDFTDLREYEPGDDLRHIDWNVTARMDTLYVRQYIEDREVTAWLLLDHSASMGFGPVNRQKTLVMAEVATTLALVLAKGGNRVGAVLFGSEVEQVIRPASGRNQVLRIARELIAEQTTPAPGATTDLAVLLRAAHGMARRRSLIVIVSDFISEPGWELLLPLLAGRHEVVAIQVADPREFEIPSVGMVYVEDAETGEQIFVDTDDPVFHRRLREVADARQAELVDATRVAGVDLYQVRTDEDLVRSLMRISALRKRRRR